MGFPTSLVYIDDILVTGRNDQEHWQILWQVLDRLREAGMREV